MTMKNDITELAQREKFEAWFVNDVVGADVTFPAFEDGEYEEGEIYDEQLYFTLQAMWMAWKAANSELVEELGKTQAERDEFRRRFNLERSILEDADRDLETLRQRIDTQREYYEGVIADGSKRIAETNLRNTALTAKIEPMERRIAELEESNAQVIQSRDHYKRMTEEGLKQLAESRAVKLPAACADDEYFIDGVFQPMRYERDVERALRAAGIKWEDE